MAQSVIGALRVSLGLDSAKFETGAKRAGSTLKQMRNQFALVATAAAAFATALSAAARQGAQEIDRTAKAARRIDSSVAGYRALEMAADDAGVSLSSLANDVQTMNRELANIGTSGNADRALERLGLSVQDLTGLDADEKLAAIADRVKALGLSAGETTAILRDLGVRNREMALLVLQGGDALRRARQDVNEFGLALSDVDAARIEAANDEIAGLADVATLLRDRIALALVPAMGDLAKSITDSLREGGLLRGVIDGLADNIQRVSTYLAVAVTGFGVRFVAALVAAKVATLTLAGSMAFLRVAIIRTGIGALVVGAGELIYQFTRLVDATGSWGDALNLLGETARGVWEGIKTSASSIAPALGAVWADIGASFSQMIADLQFKWFVFINSLSRSAAGVGLEGISSELAQVAESAGQVFDETISDVVALKSDAERLRGEASARLSGGFEAATAAAARLRDVVSAAAESTEDGAEAAERLNGAWDSIDEASAAGGGAGGAARQVEGLAEVTVEADRRAEQLKDTFGQTFADIVTGASSARDAVSQLLNSLANGLLQNAGSQIFGAVAGAFRIPGFATGTPYASGGLAMVGERGPELVQLPRGSRVFNNAESGGMMGGVNAQTVVNIDARGAQAGVAEQVRRELARELPNIERLAVASVQGARRRGFNV